MEFRLGSILIESALKIGSLADSVDVLVIVDTPAGRLFSGKGGLVDAFLTASLKPSPADVQLFVESGAIPPGLNPDLGASGNNQDFVPYGSNSGFFHEGTLRGRSFGSTPTQSNLHNALSAKSSRKRFSSNSLTPSPSKMKKTVQPSREDSSNQSKNNCAGNFATDSFSLQVQNSFTHPLNGASFPEYPLIGELTQVKSEMNESFESPQNELIELSSGDENSSSPVTTAASQDPVAKTTFSDNILDGLVEPSKLPFGCVDESFEMSDVVVAVNAAVPRLKLEAFGAASGELVSVRGSVENRCNKERFR